MRHIAIIALGMICLGAVNLLAKDNPKANSFKEALSGVPAAERPAKAAQLVKEAKARERETTTMNVVKVVLGINPAAATAIVGAVSRTVAEMAPVAAGTAAAEQPRQACTIAKAAAAAAPSQAGKIVVAVCRAVPNEYRCIAIAVSLAVPGSGKEILDAVGVALPDLKPYIEEALASHHPSGGASSLSVATTLDQATKLSQGAYRDLPSGPPSGPLLGTALAGRNSSGQSGGGGHGGGGVIGGGTGGGRDYAKPKQTP